MREVRESLSEMPVFDRIEAAPRKWKLPAVWVLTSLIGITLGMQGASQRKSLVRGWLVVALWVFVLIVWLRQLYRAYKLEAKG